VDPSTARTRIAGRVEQSPLRAAHHDLALLRALTSGESSLDAFVPISLAVPAVTVDTTDGYTPDLPSLLRFLDGRPGSLLDRAAHRPQMLAEGE
jgi:hypothetical protein